MSNILNDGTVLYSKGSCCGCGGCEWICSKSAISIQEDEDGNIYPQIDEEKCISCHLCINNCAYQGEHQAQYPKSGYALVNNDINMLNKSASGGAFSSIAEECINNGFYICGSAMIYDSDVHAEHIIINDKHSLGLIYGSKYTQSSLRKVYSNIEQILKSNKKVLFSGVPCQVAQIKKLFSKYSKYLYTIDIVCHGTPSQKLFSDYIRWLEHRENGKVINFNFRDKTYGWGKYGSALLKSNDALNKIELPQEKSSYYSFFMSGTIQRENCFSCPYAKAERCSDLTLGDYWGIEKYDPKLLKSNSGILDEKTGISAVLVNTEKGMELLEGIDATMISSDPSKIILGNSQLRHPVPKGEMYDRVNKMYRKRGYAAVEGLFGTICIKRKLKNCIKKIIRK